MCTAPFFLKIRLIGNFAETLTSPTFHGIRLKVDVNTHSRVSNVAALQSVTNFQKITACFVAHFGRSAKYCRAE